MTCAEVLSTLSTASLRDMAPDSPVMAHCATCPDCARVTTALREREYEVASLLNGLPSMTNPIAIAERSVVIAKRRRLGNIAILMTGTALALTTWIALSLTFIPAMNRADARVGSTLRTETMQLTCLSPKQAGDIISPYIRSRGSTYYLPTTGLSVITVRGTSDELAKSRNLLRDFESDPNASCRVAADADRLRRTMEAVDQAFKDNAQPALAGSPPGPTNPSAKRPTAARTK
jgi:hypothetical protein